MNDRKNMMRPERIYQRIEAKELAACLGGHGDIHGCFSMLMKRLRECRFDPQQDLLAVSVGDLIDRNLDALGYWLYCVSLLDDGGSRQS